MTLAQGKPVAVCQYNNYKGGGIIAVDYEARKYEMKRVVGDRMHVLRIAPRIIFVAYNQWQYIYGGLVHAYA